MKHEIHEATKPNLEVVIRTPNGELAVFGLFNTRANEWDVVIGIVDSDQREGVKNALDLSLSALSSADFMEPSVVAGDPPPWD